MMMMVKVYLHLDSRLLFLFEVGIVVVVIIAFVVVVVVVGGGGWWKTLQLTY